MLDEIALAAWLYALGVVVADERITPRLAPGPPAPGSVSAIVPARDEERDVSTTLRMLRASEHRDLQVIAVDDESRDGTRAAMARVDGVEVVAGTAPPEGWLGKPWACAQGAERARGDWLLFCDADVRIAPWTIDAALRLAGDGAGATVFPGLEVGGVAERVVLPAAGLLMQTAIIPTWLARQPSSGVAIGVGGFLLVRRDAYDAVGGHAAVRGAVVEDIGLARLLKRRGTPLRWARGDEAVRLRMYHGAGELWDGWRKNAADAWSAPPAATALGAGAIGVLVGAPWLGAARGRPVALGALILQCAALRIHGRTLGLPRRYALTAPLGALFLAAVGRRLAGRPAARKTAALARSRASGHALNARATAWPGGRIPQARSR